MKLNNCILKDFESRMSSLPLGLPSTDIGPVVPNKSKFINVFKYVMLCKNPSDVAKCKI